MFLFLQKRYWYVYPKPKLDYYLFQDKDEVFLVFVACSVSLFWVGTQEILTTVG